MANTRLLQIRWALDGEAGTLRLDSYSDTTTIGLSDDAGPRVLDPLHLAVVASDENDPSRQLRLTFAATATNDSLELRIEGAALYSDNVFSDETLTTRAAPFRIPFHVDGVGRPHPENVWELSFTSSDNRRPFTAALKPTLQPLRLLKDLHVTHAVGFNTLGNFGTGPEDVSIAHAPASVTVSTAEPCSIELYEHPVNMRHIELDKPEATTRIELEVLPPGEHWIAIRAFERGMSPERYSESVRLPVESEFPAYANLPVARRFAKGVDIADGHLTHTVTDFSLPARGFPLEFIRSYSNLTAATQGAIFPLSGLGIGWTHNFNCWLEPHPTAEGHFLIIGGDGSGRVYAKSTTSSHMNGTGGYHGILTADRDSMTLTTPAGIRYRYGQQVKAHAGRRYLKEIADSNGNIMRLEFNAAGRLEKVHDTSGVRYLQFTYSETEPGLIGKLVLKRVEAFYENKALDPPLQVNFTQNPAGDLIRVTRGTRTHGYTYMPGSPSPHRMSAYRDPDNSVVSYEYKNVPTGPATDPAARWELERVTSVKEGEARIVDFNHVLEQQTIDNRKILVPVRTDMTVRSVSRTLGPLSRTTYYFDPKHPTGAVKRIEYPLNETIDFVWDPVTRLLKSEKDGTGREYTYDYGDRGNVTRESLMIENVAGYLPIMSNVMKVDEIRTRYTYTSQNRIDTLTRFEVMRGKEQQIYFKRYQYDTLGRMIREEEPEGRTTDYRYSEKGDLRMKVRSDGENVTYDEYNAFGQARKIAQKIEANQELISRQDFDPRGRLVQTRDEVTGSPNVLRRIVTVFDDFDQPLRRTEFNAFGKQFMGELATPDRVSEFVYYEGGRLHERREVGPDSRALLRQVWTYDSIGRVDTLRSTQWGNPA
jgi:YD repeat-containing protein